MSSELRVNEHNLLTRIYSDCFNSIQRVILKKWDIFYIKQIIVVWFGQGLFHTNTVEGLSSKIKRLLT